MAKSEKAPSMSGSESTAGVTMRPDAPPAEETRDDPVEEQIRIRAYELYLQRGTEPSDDLSNWLQAEREYRGQSRDERSGGEDDHDWSR